MFPEISRGLTKNLAKLQIAWWGPAGAMWKASELHNSCRECGFSNLLELVQKCKARCRLFLCRNAKNWFQRSHWNQLGTSLSVLNMDMYSPTQVLLFERPIVWIFSWARGQMGQMSCNESEKKPTLKTRNKNLAIIVISHWLTESLNQRERVSYFILCIIYFSLHIF